MAQPQKPGTPNQKPATTAPTPPKPSNGMSAAQAKKDGASEPKRPRVRWVSPQDKSFWVRSYKDVTDKHGAPKDPWGNTMVAAASLPGGGAATLKAAREEREAKLAAMSETDRVAFLKAEKEARKANKAAKKQAEYDAIVAKVKAGIASGDIKM